MQKTIQDAIEALGTFEIALQEAERVLPADTAMPGLREALRFADFLATSEVSLAVENAASVRACLELMRDGVRELRAKLVAALPAR